MTRQECFSSGLFSKQVVDELLSMGDAEFIQEIVEIFEQQAPELFKWVKITVKDTDFEGSKKYMHKLKGTAGTIGAESLLDLVQERYNQMLRQNQLTASDLKAIEELLDQSVKHVRIVFNLK